MPGGPFPQAPVRVGPHGGHMAQGGQFSKVYRASPGEGGPIGLAVLFWFLGAFFTEGARKPEAQSPIPLRIRRGLRIKTNKQKPLVGLQKIFLVSVPKHTDE